jgi:hypothetical protein
MTKSKYVRLFFAAAMLSMVSWWIARGIGIEVWRDWDMGDRSDIALYVFIAVLLLGWPTSRN